MILFKYNVQIEPNTKDTPAIQYNADLDKDNSNRVKD